MSDLVNVILLTVVAVPTLVALLTMLLFLIPARIERAGEIIHASPRRTFIVGLVNLLFFAILAAFLGNAGDVAGLLAVIILLVIGALQIVGLSAFVLLLRRRLYPSPETTELSTLQMTLRTAVLLVLALLTPFIGWFVFTPILLTTGLGATIIVLVRRKQE